MQRDFKQMLSKKNRQELPSVLFVSAECAPLSKTGGLADVAGALPKALTELGMDVRIITPYHRCIKEKYASQVEHMYYFYAELGWRREYAGIEKLELDGVTIYLVDSEYYFGDRIYRGGDAEGEQYAFFTRVVLDAMPNLGFTPDIIHCNDWHTAMLPMLGRTQYPGQLQEKVKYLLSIHNIAYQGRYWFGHVEDWLGVDPKYYTPDYIELYGSASFMKAGCVFADKISTVSPSYAEEIRTPYYGEGLDGILNARAAGLCGILNGVDPKTFNPMKDAAIPSHFSSGNLAGKKKCKTALQYALGLEKNPDVPVLSMVTRMTEQKGFELVMNMLDDIMVYENVQFVLLGTGDARYEDFMRSREWKYKGRLAAYIGYNEDLAHLIYAGSDFFLMPSRFEPCGLSQMISMRYGCLPIVRETGGLKDSVIPYDAHTGEGDGFSFVEFDACKMRETVHTALECYRDKDIMQALIKNAMAQDFSFERSAKEYISLYISMLDDFVDKEVMSATVADKEATEEEKENKE